MRRITLALACLSLLPIAAKADTLNFNVTGNIPGYGSGSGVLTGTSSGSGGSYLISSITANGVGPITVLSTTSGFGNDNLFSPTSTLLVDSAGIAFSGAFGQAVLYSKGGSYFVSGKDSDGDAFSTPISLTLNSTSAATVTPEPSSILLTMSGLFGTAAFFVRKRMQGVAPQGATLA